jgi:hypothetical protein
MPVMPPVAVVRPAAAAGLLRWDLIPGGRRRRFEKPMRVSSRVRAIQVLTGGVVTVSDATSASLPPPAALQVRDVVWFLVGRLDESEVVRQIPICNSPFRVGRKATASLSLGKKEVSSVHAEFVTTGVSLLLRDLGSTNGTFVNGAQIHDTVE